MGTKSSIGCMMSNGKIAYVECRFGGEEGRPHGLPRFFADPLDIAIWGYFRR